MLALSSVIARVRTRFNAESSSSLVRWSDDAIISGINDGLDELTEGSLFYERVVSLPVTARNYYDLRGYMTDDVVSVRAVWSITRQDWLVPLSPLKLYERWEEAVGDPAGFFLRGWSWLGVYPHPSAPVAGSFLRVYFNCLAPQLTHPQAVIPELPDDFSPALEDYALYDLQAQDGESDKAVAHWQDFAARLKKASDFVKSRGKTCGRIGSR